MDEVQAPTPDRSGPANRNRKRLGWVVGGLVAGGALTAGVLAAALPATANSTSQASYTGAVTQDQHTGGNPPARSDETALTGSDAEKAKAAALVAVPGATVVRLETDADGAVYEAHLSKSDGTAVTVKFDKNFTVTGIEAGMGTTKDGGPGHGPRGGGAPGTAPSGAPSASPTG